MLGWSHSPVHMVSHVGSYMITAGTYNKQHFFNTGRKLRNVQETIHQLTEKYALTVEAWAVFSNHYHIVVNCLEEPVRIQPFIRHLHSATAREVNAIDAVAGRRVWFQYRDSCLDSQLSYYARLNYVMQNPVHHGLVKVAENYEWCSASWFLASSTPAHYKTVTSFPVDRQYANDPYIPILPAS